MVDKTGNAMKYKYRNMKGNCCHRKNKNTKSKLKMRCIPEGCPFINECCNGR